MENVNEKKERTQEIKNLENFLKEFEVKYIVEYNKIVIDSELVEVVYNNPNEFHENMFKIKIIVNQANTIRVMPLKDYVIFDSWKGTKLITKRIYLIKNIIFEPKRVFIYF